jgi:hypothetical protein
MNSILILFGVVAVIVQTVAFGLKPSTISGLSASKISTPKSLVISSSSQFARYYSDNDRQVAGMADFFADGGVGNIAGKFLEREIHLTLEKCGYKPFLHEGQSSKYFAVSFEAMNMNAVGQRPTTVGEVDALVSGNAESFQRLYETCEIKFIPEQIQTPTNHSSHILAIEAKLSSSTLVKALNSRDDPTKVWWLMQPQFHSNIYRAVIMNGGEATKAFIINGGKSNDKDTKNAWEKLATAGIMMFYVPSFSFEWGHEMINQNREIKEENREIKKENREIKEENQEIKSKLSILENAIRKLGGNID